MIKSNCKILTTCNNLNFLFYKMINSEYPTWGLGHISEFIYGMWRSLTSIVTLSCSEILNGQQWRSTFSLKLDWHDCVFHLHENNRIEFNETWQGRSYPNITVVQIWLENMGATRSGEPCGLIVASRLQDSLEKCLRLRKNIWI